MDAEALDDAYGAARDLLLLLRALGVRAVLLTQEEGGAIFARCQREADVGPMCKRVAEEYEAPEGQALN